MRFNNQWIIILVINQRATVDNRGVGGYINFDIFGGGGKMR